MELKQEKQAKLEVEATVGQLELEVKKLKADLHVRDRKSNVANAILMISGLYEHLTCTVYMYNIHVRIAGNFRPQFFYPVVESMATFYHIIVENFILFLQCKSSWAGQKFSAVQYVLYCAYLAYLIFTKADQECNRLYISFSRASFSSCLCIVDP